jgi:molybdopterin synthase sulfur carrier subunit
MVTIRYFGPFRDLTKTAEEEVPGGQTVRDLLALLEARYGETFSPSEKPVPVAGRLILLVNGRHVQHLDGLDTYLSDQDVLSVFPLIGGG